MEFTTRNRSSAGGQADPKQPRPKKTVKKQPFSFARFYRDYGLVLWLALIVFMGLVMKYFEDKYHSMQNFTEFGEDIYKVMGIPRSASDAEIKAVYRQLNHKWHPDKNPDCADCKEKFMKLKEAYKILSNPQLKKLYDSTNGRTVDVISSSTTELTRENYDELVRNSNDVWAIQVYSDDLYECHQFAKHWEEAANNLSHFANFGRISMLLNPKAAKKLRVKVQLLPAVIMVFPGGGFDLFPQEALRSFKHFKEYFVQVYPDKVVACKDQAEFKQKAEAVVGRPALIFRNDGNNRPAPLAIRHLALKYKWAFDTYWTSSTVPAHQDKVFIDDLMDASKGQSNLVPTTAIFQLREDLDALAIMYGADHVGLIATAPYSRGQIGPLVECIESMLVLAYPPLELSRDTFTHLCKNPESTRDRFCVVVVGDAHRAFDEKKVLERLAQFVHGARIGSVFSNEFSDPEASGAAVPTADVQLVRLPEAQSTPKLREFVASGVILLDAARNKFCTVESADKRFECGVQDDLAWVGDVAEGAFDTLAWHDTNQAFGGSFEDKCLKSKRLWDRFF
ncbi:DnaJ domain containing protein, putative [Babesia bigemina]|uniref:DnaJ domain containing protein, putative n=1 Tax=Babesia bigemina TaxID=5866 RepID=A0A061CZH6_BABBI|nr:DnaJ domain containing protein, putative [Babesia bigemina]CDR94031.1 DnaJ domain containing protein, putative [Babesia bigemina]|eukprot:XP_012766217.1 DnaJ domain containing protein, putative [Babesia bigemina]